MPVNRTMNPRNAMTAPIIQPRPFPPFPQSPNTESIASLWSSMNFSNTFSKSNGGSPSSPLSSRAKILRSPDGTRVLVTHQSAPPTLTANNNQGNIRLIEGPVKGPGRRARHGRVGYDSGRDVSLLPGVLRHPAGSEGYGPIGGSCGGI